MTISFFPIHPVVAQFEARVEQGVSTAIVFRPSANTSRITPDDETVPDAGEGDDAACPRPDS